MLLPEKDNTIRALKEQLDNQSRSSAQLEDRCTSLKTTVDQLKDRLQKAAATEAELRSEINSLHKERSEQGHSIQIYQDKLKQLQKTLSNIENDKRILNERLDASQNNVNELRRNQQTQQDTIQRLQEQIAELEIQKSSLESQLRIVKWKIENGGAGDENNGDLSQQLMKLEREKSELQRKLDIYKDKVKQLENERQRKYSDSPYHRQTVSKEIFNCGLDHAAIEQENRDLRTKVRRLETLLAEKEAELARAKTRLLDSSNKCLSSDSDRYRNTQLHAEKLLDAREQAHKQQVVRLENQVCVFVFFIILILFSLCLAFLRYQCLENNWHKKLNVVNNIFYEVLGLVERCNI